MSRVVIAARDSPPSDRDRADVVCDGRTDAALPLSPVLPWRSDAALSVGPDPALNHPARASPVITHHGDAGP